MKDKNYLLLCHRHVLMKINKENCIKENCNKKL